MKKLFIFDFDGTLFNTIGQLVHNMNQALKANGFRELTLDDYKLAVGGNLNQVISNVLQSDSNPDNIESVKKSYLDIVKDFEDNITLPFDGIEEILTYLQDNNIQLAINSNRYTPSIEFYVKKFLNNIKFLDIQGHNPPNPSKPDAYGINQILNKTSIDKKDVVYVGDSPTDIKTAKNAGIDCIIVTWGYADYDLIDDDYILKTISEPGQLKDVIRLSN
ncbi:MAG: hypothetical protein BZ137_01210 [Methanosphaera sp. rholeuAM130]|nr:MAG: hypothetical protein BZ137_01210 [Methanosphaera sp. rholeuAM130]